MAVRLLLGSAFPVARALGLLLIGLLAHPAPTGTAFVAYLHLALVALVLQHLARVQRAQRAIRACFHNLRHAHTLGVRAQRGSAQGIALAVGISDFPGQKINAVQAHVCQAGALARLHLPVLVDIHPNLDSRKGRVACVKHAIAIGV